MSGYPDYLSVLNSLWGNDFHFMSEAGVGNAAASCKPVPARDHPPSTLLFVPDLERAPLQILLHRDALPWIGVSGAKGDEPARRALKRAVQRACVQLDKRHAHGVDRCSGFLRSRVGHPRTFSGIPNRRQK